LQPYPVVAADALLEIGTAVIPAVLSLDEHLSHTNKHFLCPEIRYQSVLYGTSLSGHAFLNAAKKVTNDFNAK
jgi:hypothetical protein